MSSRKTYQTVISDNLVTISKVFCLAGLLLSANAFSACDFDTDDADSPNFMDRIIGCEKQSKVSAKKSVSTVTTELYGEGTVDPVSGMAERPVAAPGSMNHSSGKSFAARQSYSLRPNAKFEESVTIAIQRLHVEMAHYCAEGWAVEKQWTEVNRQREGDFYLHYLFRCAS